MLAAAIVLSAASIGDASPRLDFTEYEAEDQKTSGIILGPDRTPGTVAAEASGRRAVWLENTHESIEFILRAPARGITLRYSLPNRTNGERETSSALIEADGREIARLALRSRYSASPQPPNGQSSDAPVHHFWQEVRVLLPIQLQAGTPVSVRPAPDSQGKAFAVDLIDTEAIPPPLQAPRNALSVLLFGADPSGLRRSDSAFVHAIAAARQSRRPLYVPPGRYQVDGHLILDRISITGAGSWYSIIFGHGLGLYSLSAGSSRVSVSDLAIESDVAARQDRLPLAAIGGRFSTSSFTRLYLHRAKVGMWFDGPANDLSIRNVEIADQAADGINLHRGISGAVVEGNSIRNVDDDGIASWSDGIPNERIRIRANRIAAIGLANGIAAYGGSGIEITNNRISDTLTEGGGIHLGTRFHSSPFTGNIEIADNLILRSGSLDPHWHFGVGAIWLYALEKPIDARIRIRNNRIEEPTCEAVQMLGPKSIGAVRIEGLRIKGPVETVLALQTAGSLYAARVVSDQIPLEPIVEVPRNMNVTMGTGNRGWKTRSVAQSDAPRCAGSSKAQSTGRL